MFILLVPPNNIINDRVPSKLFLNTGEMSRLLEGIMQTSSEAREMSLLYQQFRPDWNEECDDGQLQSSNLLPEIVEQSLAINGCAVGWYLTPQSVDVFLSW